MEDTHFLRYPTSWHGIWNPVKHAKKTWKTPHSNPFFTTWDLSMLPMSLRRCFSAIVCHGGVFGKVVYWTQTEMADNPASEPDGRSKTSQAAVGRNMARHLGGLQVNDSTDNSGR
ncbi:hypothetical protein GJ744_000816 [Endocarpon pusillum]|uniref:Uncharacterized protein n=1 Tax=Endocarpon pusillum TaxID=364733 RepID=A0A8H7AWT2_9EURO|nr:hypothetical protein GJ744_000816 [Endocarpon pusillum]